MKFKKYKAYKLDNDIKIDLGFIYEYEDGCFFDIIDPTPLLKLKSHLIFANKEEFLKKNNDYTIDNKYEDIELKIKMEKKDKETMVKLDVVKK